MVDGAMKFMIDGAIVNITLLSKILVIHCSSKLRFCAYNIVKGPLMETTQFKFCFTSQSLFVVMSLLVHVLDCGYTIVASIWTLCNILLYIFNIHKYNSFVTEVHGRIMGLWLIQNIDSI